MGFVGVVKFALKCVDVLAWYLCALVYPLCASIQAIETGSSSDTSKLVAYWVLFSLLFLFEQAFGKLLQWIPLWPYIKLITFCWLAIPNFNGALYVYKHFLRPCLYMDTKVVFSRFINRFKDGMEFFFKRNELEAEVKKYLKENGPQASEELVATKVKVLRANCVEKDVKTVEVTEKKDLSTAKKVYPTEHELSQTQNKNFSPKKIKETLEPVASVTESPERPVSNKFQKWTCPLCQVTTESEITRNSHLQGQRHKAATEKLKAKNQASTKAVWEDVKAKNQPAKKSASEVVKAKNQLLETKVTPASEHKRSGLMVQKPENSASISQKLQFQQENKDKCVEQRGALWWCIICNASCTCMQNMESHLKGMKHLAKVRQLNGRS